MSATDRPLAPGVAAIATLWAGLLHIGVAAGAQPLLTDADIERARTQHPMPSDAELARIPVPAAPRIEALPRPAPQPPIDLEALAKGFDVQAGPPGLGAARGPSLLVFVSFAMPEATITRLLDQSSRARATLVLRGLVNGSIRDTVARMQRLIGERQVAMQIDPQAFDRYAVDRTPAFVLVRSGAAARSCATGTCARSEDYVLARGDVSLDYALQFFARSSPALAQDASTFLQRMQGTLR